MTNEDSGWIPQQVVRDLQLDQQGFAPEQREPWLTALAPDGATLELSRDVARSAHAISRLSSRDGGRWPAFCARMSRLAALLESLYCAPPPDPMTRTLGGYAELAKLGLRARGLGREGLEDLLRLLPMSAADFLDEWFESELLKGALGSLGVRNLAQGPRSGGTAFNFLHHHVGNSPSVFTPARSNALEVLRRLLASDIRDGRAATIEVRDGAVEGVALESGEAIPASTVVSGADPRRTLTGLIDVAWLDPELVRAVRNVRARGVAARVTFTLDAPAKFATLTVVPSLDAIERAYDGWKHGGISAEPLFEAVACERDGRHIVRVHVQYVPHDVPEDECDAARAAIADCVRGKFAERLGANITSTDVQLPQDLAHACGFPEGQPNHAELALDQTLWMRPVPQLARYRTPIRGLYLCGPAMHPGIAALAGANAAKVIARELKRVRTA